MAAPLASVLIPVYNRTQDLLELLADLNAQDFRDFEVVVVDDGSTPPVEASVNASSYSFPFRLIRTEENHGIGHARNIALDNAKGNIVIWIDSDSLVPDRDWVGGHVRFHESDPRNYGLDAKGPVVLHSRVTGNRPSYAGRSFMYSNWFASCRTEPMVLKQHHVPTNNTSVPLELMQRVGRFDEKLRAAEDLDWALRAMAMDVPLCYLPDFPVLHKDRDTLSKLWSSFIHTGDYCRRVRVKYPQSPYGWLYPTNPLLARLQILPLAVLITLYTTLEWLTVERRVLFYVPGMFLANLAYAVGTVRAVRNTA